MRSEEEIRVMVKRMRYYSSKTECNRGFKNCLRWILNDKGEK
jgi:hypothetical protein